MSDLGRQARVVVPLVVALCGPFLAQVAKGFLPWYGSQEVAVAQEQRGATPRTVWDGIFTEGQAARGRVEYARSCGSCHSPDLGGDGTAPGLVGESFAFLFDDMTVGALFDRIRTAMPPGQPNSLPEETYADIMTYIFQSNRLPSGSSELDPTTVVAKAIRITKAGPAR